MNPYFVLGPRDGQILIKYVWGNSIGMMGSGEDVNGYFCDILSMNLKDGEKQLYFNIDHATKNVLRITFGLRKLHKICCNFAKDVKCKG